MTLIGISTAKTSSWLDRGGPSCGISRRQRHDIGTPWQTCAPRADPDVPNGPSRQAPRIQPFPQADGYGTATGRGALAGMPDSPCLPIQGSSRRSTARQRHHPVPDAWDTIRHGSRRARRAPDRVDLRGSRQPRSVPDPRQPHLEDRSTCSLQHRRRRLAHMATTHRCTGPCRQGSRCRLWYGRHLGTPRRLPIDARHGRCHRHVPGDGPDSGLGNGSPRRRG